MVSGPSTKRSGHAADGHECGPDLSTYYSRGGSHAADGHEWEPDLLENQIRNVGVASYSVVIEVNVEKLG